MEAGRREQGWCLNPANSCHAGNEPHPGGAWSPWWHPGHSPRAGGTGRTGQLSRHSPQGTQLGGSSMPRLGWGQPTASWGQACVGNRHGKIGTGLSIARDHRSAMPGHGKLPAREGLGHGMVQHHSPYAPCGASPEESLCRSCIPSSLSPMLVSDREHPGQEGSHTELSSLPPVVAVEGRSRWMVILPFIPTRWTFLSLCHLLHHPLSVWGLHPLSSRGAPVQSSVLCPPVEGSRRDPAALSCLGGPWGWFMARSPLSFQGSRAH